MFIESLLVGVLAWHVVSELLHLRERQRLEDRLMARSFNEFKYYEEQFPKELKVATKAKEKEIEKVFQDKQEENKVTKKFIEGLEEDWLEEEIDTEKLPETDNEFTINREDNS